MSTPTTEHDLTETLTSLQSSLNNLTSLLDPLTSSPLEETLEGMDLVHKAKMNVLIAYGVCNLVWTLLKTRGVDPSTHPVMKELQRIQSYYQKVKDAELGPPQRTQRLDVAAASRFITHAIPRAQRVGVSVPGSVAGSVSGLGVGSGSGQGLGFGSGSGLGGDGEVGTYNRFRHAAIGFAEDISKRPGSLSSSGSGSGESGEEEEEVGQEQEGILSSSGKGKGKGRAMDVDEGGVSSNVSPRKRGAEDLFEGEDGHGQRKKRRPVASDFLNKPTPSASTSVLSSRASTPLSQSLKEREGMEGSPTPSNSSLSKGQQKAARKAKKAAREAREVREL